MDYDDNDFQSQNFHLVGEDNSRFSPSLRSYTLPRYDLDDNLQVHLGFDIDETEVLLGIQHQQDNRWIEDFSQGSSGIEFSSSAADSCSISRRNNVWSEATSSESVEMLLKSVGQDEGITKQTIVEEPVAFDGHVSLSEQMDSSLERDQSFPAASGGLSDTGPTLPSDKHIESLPGPHSYTSDGIGSLRSAPESTLNKDHCKLSPATNFSGTNLTLLSEKSTEALAEFTETATGNPLVEAAPYTHKDDESGPENEVGKDHIAFDKLDIQHPTSALAGKFVGDSSAEKTADSDYVSVSNVVSSEDPGNATMESVQNSCTTPLTERGTVDFDNQEFQCQVADGLSEILIGEKLDGSLEDDVQERAIMSKDALAGKLHPSQVTAENAAAEKGNSFEFNSLEGSCTDTKRTEHLGDPTVQDLQVASFCKPQDEVKPVDQENHNEVSSSSLENQNGFKGEGSRIERGDYSTSVVKVYSPADLIQTTEVLTNMENCKDKLGTPALESTPENLVSSVAVDKVIENQTSVDLEAPRPTELLGTSASESAGLSDTHKEIDNVGSFTERSAELMCLGERAYTVPAVVQVMLNGPNVDGESVSVRVDFSDSGELKSSGEVNMQQELNAGCDVHVDSLEKKEVQASSQEILNVDKEDHLARTSTKSSLSDPAPSADSLPASDNIAAELLCSGGESPAFLESSVSAVETQSSFQPITAVKEHESDDIIAQSIASTSTHRSSLDVGHNSQKDGCISQSDVVGGVHIVHAMVPGGVTNHCEESSDNLLTKNVTDPDSVEVTDDPISDEPNYGSPIIISPLEQSYIEKEHKEEDSKLADQSCSVGDNPEVVASAVDKETDIGKSTSKDVSEADRSFTFEVGTSRGLTEGETCKVWKSFPSVQSSEVNKIQGLSSKESESSQAAPALLQDDSHGSLQVSDETKVVHDLPANISGNAKHSGTPSRGTSTKGKSLKATSSKKHKVDKDAKLSSPPPNSAGAIGRAMPVEEVRLYPYADGSNPKASAIPATQTSNLPDLNSSASTALFHQPFTDLQQVQLRAQIFVYGFLIQGAVPDEACMLSAFGDLSRDGGRSMWESTWRNAVERLDNQKSPLNNVDTPLAVRSGVRLSDQVPGSEGTQIKLVSASTGRSSSKVGVPSPAMSLALSSSSPLWSITTTTRDALQSSNLSRGPFLDNHQSFPFLNPYQSPQIRQYMGSTTPWLTQISSCGPPWVVAPQSSGIDAGQQYSALPTSEAIQVTPVRETSALNVSSVSHVPRTPLAPTVGPTSLSSCTSVMELEKTLQSPGKLAAADPKSRKRKKNSSPLDLVQMPTVALPQAEQTLVASVNKPPTASTGILSSSHAISSKVSFGNVVGNTSPPVCSPHFQVISGRDTSQKVLPEDTSSGIEQAKVQAESAAALAVSAVKLCQDVWSQLSQQKNSGLITEIDVQIASAAVAAAAAASVANAAAAAAKIASDAAMQAKLMADDALGMGNSGQIKHTISSDGESLFGRMGPASTFKGKDKANSSIIIAAREAARRRVEAASAAAKRAENLDAVVKAAEIAAEAVAQAGTVIAMGDPVPLKLSELLQSGPEGYWKLQQASVERKGGQDLLSVEGVDKSPISKPDGGRTGKKGNQETLKGRLPHSREALGQPGENVGGQANGIGWVSLSDKSPGAQRGHKLSELAKSVGVVPESDRVTGVAASFISHPVNDNKENWLGTSAVNGISEGSVVEVVSEEDGLRGVWFSAKVLHMEDGKAFVCYDELLADGGPGHLKEWVLFEGEGNRPPRIRIAHPMTAIIKYEGTRKRRRAAIGNYAWSIGDQVDVWVQNGWWEAVITANDKDDDSKLTVQFTEGHSSTVRTWNIRPSLVWRGGQWVEWTKGNSGGSMEGDSPLVKRQKSRHEDGIQSQVERADETLVKDVAVVNSRKPENAWSNQLTEKEKTFTIGKTAGNDKISDALRVKRIGLQKEGSKVIFGVPKPGKKRKFMEVSKHYVTDKAPMQTEGADPMKFTKYLMPQSSARGWKNAPKLDFKGKPPLDPKIKMPRSGKTPSLQHRSVLEKDSSSMSAGHDPLLNAKSSESHEESSVGKQNPMEGVSSVETVKAPGTAAHTVVSTNVPLPKKIPSSAAEADKGVKGKTGPAAKFVREENATSVPGRAEPRRSNRRIQPTSRLLEGLQSSSLVVAKMPPVSSQDKVNRARQRNASSSRGR